MGLQKYRADIMSQTQSDGSVPWFTKWMGGPSLSLIRNCPTPFGPRTVYVRGEPDSWFSIPAACVHKRKTITGYITNGNMNGEYVFRAHVDQT